MHMLLEVKDLKKYFKIRRDLWLKAVDGVSFSIEKGETLGLVGESGCGKSTLGRTIVGLYEPTDGQLIYDGQDITKYTPKQRRELTRRMQMIYQDPYASLDPRMTVADIIGEGIKIHRIASGAEKQEMIYRILDQVGLNKEHANRFPHEFSGGQRQRVGIARALVIGPEFIVCDEPISALDVSIQAQVINLMKDLQEEMGLTYLFIAHDISMVAHISDRIAVMYLGKIMETGNSEEIMEHAQHPYTKALLSAVPFADPMASRARDRIRLTGDIPSPMSVTQGCKFASRCQFCTERCRREDPQMKEIAPGHHAACHLIG